MTLKLQSQNYNSENISKKLQSGSILDLIEVLELETLQYVKKIRAVNLNLLPFGQTGQQKEEIVTRFSIITSEFTKLVQDISEKQKIYQTTLNNSKDTEIKIKLC